MKIDTGVTTAIVFMHKGALTVYGSSLRSGDPHNWAKLQIVVEFYFLMK